MSGFARSSGFGTKAMLLGVDPGSIAVTKKVAGIFDKPKVQQPQVPDAPSINDAEVSAEQSADDLRRRRGMAATILAGEAPAPNTRAAQLLGS